MPVKTPVGSCFLRQGCLDEEIFRDASKATSNKTTNEVRKRIDSALLEEVTERRTAPELLRPESIHFEAVDEELFELVQQAKRLSTATSYGSAAHRNIIKRLTELDLTGSHVRGADHSHVRHAEAPRRPLASSAEALEAEERSRLANWRPVGPPEWLLFRYRPQAEVS